jgi:hypothetical protein
VDTYTEGQIRDAVMTYSEGCMQGKIDFLGRAFGIEAKCEMVVELTVRITLDAYNGDGMVEESDVRREVESLIDLRLGNELDVENVDARVNLA